MSNGQKIYCFFLFLFVFYKAIFKLEHYLKDSNSLDIICKPLFYIFAHLFIHYSYGVLKLENAITLLKGIWQKS